MNRDLSEYEIDESDQPDDEEDVLERMEHREDAYHDYQNIRDWYYAGQKTNDRAINKRLIDPATFHS